MFNFFHKYITLTNKCLYISALKMTPLTLEASRSVTIYVAELAHIAVAWVLEMSFPYLMEKGCSIDILNEDGITSICRVCFGDFFSIFDGERLFK